jgi:hypothetical protein
MRSFWSRNWRRDIHAHPELQYDVHRTAGAVADKLKNFGCDEVVTGIGRTGLVGVIRGSKATAGQRTAEALSPVRTFMRANRPRDRTHPAGCDALLVLADSALLDLREHIAGLAPKTSAADIFLNSRVYGGRHIGWVRPLPERQLPTCRDLREEGA